jgi:broad specificity phosphatase PhoE
MHQDIMKIATLTLVRHGMTEWAAAGRHTSITDVALTAAGEAQAKALKPYLAAMQFDAVYSSPMLRARHTALLAGFANATLEPDLGEWRYGRYEGKATTEILEEKPSWSVFRNGAPEGETPDQVAKRCDRLLRLWQQKGHQHVLCFSHGHLLRALATRWICQDMGFGSHLHLDPGSISRLGWEHRTPALRQWNSCSTQTG